jgi:hypothetical protein
MQIKSTRLPSFSLRYSKFSRNPLTSLILTSKQTPYPFAKDRILYNYSENFGAQYLLKRVIAVA